MTLPAGFLENTRMIVVRRGESMAVNLPVDPLAMTLRRIKPPEIALEAAKVMVELQLSMPGRADMPIVPGDKPFGLARVGSEYVLDPEVPIMQQLEGWWTDMMLDVLDPTTGEVVSVNLPTVQLNLDDIERPSTTL